jgi:DNA-binding GntR family transcriptional regulator
MSYPPEEPGKTAVIANTSARFVVLRPPCFRYSIHHCMQSSISFSCRVVPRLLTVVRSSDLRGRQPLAQVSKAKVRAKAETGKVKQKPGDLNENVYAALREMILSGALRPGVRLVHQDLADQLQVSRTPVRESLERLYQEGYAARRARRGYFVAEVGAEEVKNLYGTREALEIYAFQVVSARGFEDYEIATLESLNAEYASLFPASVNRSRLAVDQNFHQTLASFSRNEHLRRTLIAVFEKIELKRRLDGFGLVVGDQPLREHQELVDAIKARRYDKAEGILRDHIRQASVRLLEHLEANAISRQASVPRVGVR